MSKAEKFIHDYTRGCSNELIAVESKDGNEVISYHEWLTPEQARKAVEIEREEVIEKVCEFFENHLCCYIKAQDFTIEHSRLEQDFKKHMEDK